MVINNYLTTKYILIIFFNIIILILSFVQKQKKIIKKVGVIGVVHETNIGNNLIKYAMSIKLKELGYSPYIIGTHMDNTNISFINRTTNLVIIKKNFSEIKKDDYDILMVNSDQTWRKFDKHFYDYGFLKFAKNWNIKKFVYGASIGYDDWKLTYEDDQIAKSLLKNFTEISIREKGSKQLIEQHFGINPTVVLDPTLLIDKNYYLNIIKDYKSERNIKNKYIFIYTIFHSEYITDAINQAKKIFNYETYYFLLNKNSSIEEFIYYMIKSKAVVTNSYHGTVLSIIFNKPFITIYDKSNAKERFTSLANLFGVHERIFENNQKINYEQLIKPLNLDYKLLNKLRSKSINFLKRNLEK